MQRRELVCLDCAKRIMGYPDSMDLDFDESMVEGKVVGRFICDACGNGIDYGARAVAWTQWTARTPKQEWESQYLMDTVIKKEVRR